MKFSPNLDDVKVIHQGVDTLLVGYVSTNLEAYDKQFKPFLKQLEEHKENAQLVNGFDASSRFVKANLLGLGDFMIYAQGSRAFAYKIQNQDFLMFISNTKYGANEFQTAQIKVEFRNHFLFSAGHKKAFDLVNIMVKKMMGDFKSQLLRIDLCSDVQGVRYTSLDKFRFQTNFKKSEYTQFNEYTKGHKTTGFSIGGGDFLFRIYDKLEEIKNNPSKEFVITKWIMNGYSQKQNLSVFRHEIQLRREILKKYQPKNLDCEVTFNFNQLDKLWKLATLKVTWTDLTDNECVRISENNLASSTIRGIFFTARKEVNDGDTLRIDYWNVLTHWDNVLCSQVVRYEDIKIPQVKTAEKYLKAFVSSTYKALGSNPSNLIDIVTDVQLKLQNFDGISLHQHGQLKELSSFVENAKVIERLELNPINDFSHRAVEKFWALNDKLREIDNPLVKSTKSYLSERGLLDNKNAS